MPRLSFRNPLWLLLVLLGVSSSVASAQSSEPDRVRAVVDKVRELREAEEALLSDLTPEERAEVERRLAAIAAEEGTSGDGSAADTPPGSVTNGQRGSTTNGQRASTTTTPATDLTSPRAPAATGPARCNTLLLFDSNGDGKFSGADRHWRHFAVWWQGDPDGTPEPRQLESLLPGGVREIALDLRSWQDRRGTDSDIRLDRAIRLVERRRRDEREGLFVLDASALRDAGGPSLVNAEGKDLSGVQLLRPGLGLRVESGELYPFDCP